MKRKEAETLGTILGSLQMDVYGSLCQMAGHERQHKVAEELTIIKEEFDKVHEYIWACVGGKR